MGISLCRSVPLAREQPLLDLRDDCVGRVVDVADVVADALAEQTDGWLYLVTVTGTTGARSELSAALAGLVERTRAVTEVPLLAGFGISTPEQARAAAELADGIVVGSAAVEAADEGASALRDYVASLRSGIDASVTA